MWSLLRRRTARRPCVELATYAQDDVLGRRGGQSQRRDDLSGVALRAVQRFVAAREERRLLAVAGEGSQVPAKDRSSVPHHVRSASSLGSNTISGAMSAPLIVIIRRTTLTYRHCGSYDSVRHRAADSRPNSARSTLMPLSFHFGMARRRPGGRCRCDAVELDVAGRLLHAGGKIGPQQRRRARAAGIRRVAEASGAPLGSTLGGHHHKSWIANDDPFRGEREGGRIAHAAMARRAALGGGRCPEPMTASGGWPHTRSMSALWARAICSGVNTGGISRGRWLKAAFRWRRGRAGRTDCGAAGRPADSQARVPADQQIGHRHHDLSIAGQGLRAARLARTGEVVVGGLPGLSDEVFGREKRGRRRRPRGWGASKDASSGSGMSSSASVSSLSPRSAQAAAPMLARCCRHGRRGAHSRVRSGSRALVGRCRIDGRRNTSTGTRMRGYQGCKSRYEATTRRSPHRQGKRPVRYAGL